MTKWNKQLRDKSLKYYKVYVFDLDNTLYLHKRSDKKTVHKEVKNHLETLKSRGKKLYIATHNKYPWDLLREMGILDTVHGIKYEKKKVNALINSIDEYTNKSEMITEIVNDEDCSINDVVFFDDADYNVENVRKIGVRSVLVDEDKGIELEALRRIKRRK